MSHADMIYVDITEQIRCSAEPAVKVIRRYPYFISLYLLALN